MANDVLDKAIKDAVSGTFVDRFVRWRDPIKGLQRQRARVSLALATSYTGASKSTSGGRSWVTRTKTANQDLLPELDTLRGRCRDLERNQPIASGALHTVTTSVIGSGLRLQSSVNYKVLGISEDKADALQEKIEYDFNCWADSKDCDIERSLNFYEQQPLAFHNCLLNGDGLTVLPMHSVDTLEYKTRIQLIEADRVCNRDGRRDTSKLVAGIHLDSNGAPTAYDILQSDPATLFGKAKKWDTVQRFGQETNRINAIHLFLKKRPGQIRGLPYLSAVIEPLKNLGKYTEAELVAAVVSGMFSVFIKTSEGKGAMLGGTEISSGEDQVRDYQLGVGSILEGLPGDEMETINPGRPNDSFDPFVMAILRQVGVALELPFEVLIKHFTSSYTAARASLLEAWKLYRKRRRWMALNYCQPIFETWLLEAVTLGIISAPGFVKDLRVRKAYCGAVWHGDGMGVLDPNREVAAADKRIVVGITTLPEEIAAYDGGNWEDKHRVQAKVSKVRIGDGLQKPIKNTSFKN